MKNKPLLIATLLLLYISGISQTPGSLQINLTTETYNGRYAPKHCVVVWVENSGGNLIRTTALHAQRYKWTLQVWGAVVTAAGNNESLGVDAVTGASRNQHAVLNSKWDAKDRNNNVVADGTYKVWIEMTENNDAGKYYSFEFTKGPAPVELNPANVSGFRNISIVWTPEIVITNEKPTITITSPNNGASIEDGSIEITAQAQDKEGGIDNVEFWMNDALIGTDYSAPYSISIDAYAAGSANITAIAIDNEGAKSDPSEINITIPCIETFRAHGTSMGTENTIENAFDNNELTYFDAPTTPGSWVGMNLGSPQEIVSLKILPRSTNPERLENIKIQLSNDASFANAITVATTANITNNWTCYYISATEAYQYFRLYDEDGGRFNVAEIECYTKTQMMPRYDGTGLNAIYFNDALLQNAVYDTFGENIAFNWNSSTPDNVNSTEFSALWQGKIIAPSTGLCNFFITTANNVKLWVDNKLIIDEWNNYSDQEFGGSIQLEKDKKYAIRIEYAKSGNTANIALSWQPDGYSKSIIDKSFLYPEVTQKISLANGWNLISFYALPADNSVSAIFSELPISFIKNDAGFFQANKPEYFNSLANIEAGKGYFVYVDSKDGNEIELTIDGNVVSSFYFTVDNYSSGWNLAGIGSYQIHIDKIQYDIETIKSLDNYWNGNNLGGLETLEPGKGYFLKK